MKATTRRSGRAAVEVDMERRSIARCCAMPRASDDRSMACHVSAQ